MEMEMEVVHHNHNIHDSRAAGSRLRHIFAGERGGRNRAFLHVETKKRASIPSCSKFHTTEDRHTYIMSVCPLNTSSESHRWFILIVG
jgi:hypothetical protein